MKERLLEFAKAHTGAIAGTLLGLLTGILLLSMGFWRTLLLCALVGVGFAIGRAADNKITFVELVFRVYDTLKHWFSKIN